MTTSIIISTSDVDNMCDAIDLLDNISKLAICYNKPPITGINIIAELSLTFKYLKQNLNIKDDIYGDNKYSIEVKNTLDEVITFHQEYFNRHYVIHNDFFIDLYNAQKKLNIIYNSYYGDD
jgi:hypothetical protein